MPAGHGGPPLRFGVLGAGRIGARHARNLAGAIPGAELAVVFDADADAAARAAFAGARVARDADELTFAAEVDAVLIASPTPFHAAQIEAAAAAGKAIFCEKPVALDAAATLRAMQAVRDAGVPFQIGLNRRFDPHLGALAKAVREGALGRVEMFRSLSSDPAPPPASYLAASGGLYRDSAIHDLDLARYALGEVERVSAYGRALVDPVFAAHDDVDTSVVVLEFASGALGVVQNSRRTAYGYEARVEAMGERGKLVAEDPQATKLWRFDVDGVHSDHASDFLDRFTEAYRAELRAFVNAVQAGRPPEPGPEDAEASLALALTADAARRSGRPETYRPLAEWANAHAAEGTA